MQKEGRKHETRKDKHDDAFMKYPELLAMTDRNLRQLLFEDFKKMEGNYMTREQAKHVHQDITDQIERNLILEVEE